MVNLKLIDQPISAPVVVCYKFDSLIKLRIFFNGPLEMRLGLLTFYFRRPKGSQKIFLWSSLDNGTICISTSWSIITMFVIFPVFLSKLCVTHTLEIWKTKFLPPHQVPLDFGVFQIPLHVQAVLHWKQENVCFIFVLQLKTVTPGCSWNSFWEAKIPYEKWNEFMWSLS